jgi:hypothetical protein
LAITPIASAAAHAAPPVSTADRRRTNITILLQVRFALLSTPARYQGLFDPLLPEEIAEIRAALPAQGAGPRCPC